MRKFINGIIYGLGFGIGTLFVFWISLNFLTPKFLPSEEFRTSENAELSDEKVSFYELKLEDKLKNSSAILLIEYQKSEDGRYLAIVSEIFKLEEGIKFYYEVGDEHVSSSYYPEENVRYGEGQIQFYFGSPATMKSSASIYGGRVKTFGDIKVSQIKELIQAQRITSR